MDFTVFLKGDFKIKGAKKEPGISLKIFSDR